MSTLVPLSARHASDLEALTGKDPDPPWKAMPGRSARQRVLAFVDRAQRLRARNAHETFAIFDGKRLVGIAVLARDPAASDRAELGYWISRPDRGQGYATAAARQLVSHGFSRMALAVVVALCPNANHASARVVEKLGFRFVGATLGAGLRRYEVTRDQWLER
jgi:ribosomal-protein-alanine N-acetyltransferase